MANAAADVAELDFAAFLTFIAVPPGSQHFATTVEVSQNGATFDVLVEARLRAAAGEVFSTFQSIDPATQLPPDVLIGFLPPEDGKGHGQGHFSYVVYNGGEAKLSLTPAPTITSLEFSPHKKPISPRIRPTTKPNRTY